LHLLVEEAQRLPNPRLVRAFQFVENNTVASSLGEGFWAEFRGSAAYHPACELKSTTMKKAPGGHPRKSEGPMQLAGIE
jgi:hypothetical protein